MGDGALRRRRPRDPSLRRFAHNRRFNGRCKGGTRAVQSKAIHSINGVSMHLDTSEAIQATMVAGLYEPVQTSWVAEKLRLGGVFVDVGANFGWFTTLALSKVGKKGRVFSFEPSPVAFGTLRDSLPSSSFPHATLVNVAVGSEPGETIVYLPNSGEVHSPSVFSTPGDFRPHTVPRISLDTYPPFANINRIDIVKMDVEGSEPDVLEGMVGLIRAGKVRRILCEFNTGWLKFNNSTSTSEALEKRFAELGFEIETATEWSSGPDSLGGTFSTRDILYKYVGSGFFSLIRSIFH